MTLATLRLAALPLLMAPMLARAQADLPTPDDEARTRQTPKWEAGVAVGAARFADYPASQDYQNLILPAPYFVYHGEVLRADDEGSRLRRRLTPDVEINFSGDGAFAQNARGVRSGMPDLDFLLEAGPSLRVSFPHAIEGAKIDIDLPLRAAVSVGGGVHGQGLVTEPELTLRFAPMLQHRLRLQTSVSAKFSSVQLQRYFYEVQPQYATAARPAYAADAGYLGASFGGSALYAFTRRVRGFVAVRGYDFAGAANTDSPLFRRNTGYALALGFSWSFYQSSQLASD